MKMRKHSLMTVLAGSMMLILILDAKLVVTGAITGIELCLWTVVPSLFPFFVVSSLINSSIGSKRIGLFRYIGKLFSVPAGSAHIVVVGLLGGYPIGAQGIMDAYNAGSLTKQDASRMLTFCNNAGPAFIFGMVSQLFDSPVTGWYLWLITVLSSLFVAVSIPSAGSSDKCSHQPKAAAFTQLVTNAVRAMANVCTWVILFRILLTILQNRVFHGGYPFLQTVLFGFLELSNGVIQTAAISDPCIRFVLCAVFLNAGGLCVAMQTHSITKELGLRAYLLGKALQTVYSLFLSLMLVPVVFHRGNVLISLLCALICAALMLFAQVFKKSIAISRKILYYIEN